MLVATALAVSAVGFFRVVWFISIGYGYAIAAMAGLLAWLAGSGMSWLLATQLVLLFAYGARLGTHVLMRGGQAAYRRAAQASYGEINIGLGKRFMIWIAVSLLYVMMFSPAAFLARQPPAVPALAVAGLILMTAGLALEAAADWQKSAAKIFASERFCDRGLFAWLRFAVHGGRPI